MIIGTVLIALVAVLLVHKSLREPSSGTSENTVSFETVTIAPTIAPTATISASKSIDIADMAFVAQAPYGDWKDPRQQDGCEEASVMVAVSWAQGRKLDKKSGLSTILDMAQYQVTEYGSSIDTSASDTLVRLVNGYFQHSKARLINIENWKQLVMFLYEDNIIIVPTNGQLLGNPNFTHHGPERHMLVIKGYDAKSGEFITHDVGTRQGENYRYDVNVLFDAIRDYPTGNHIPIQANVKNAILVWK